ncbi:MAG: hypothetical protein H6Q68_2020 [Firmicutes bacterium]|nr:hypothetical protein [Bacillota bacterium]
MSMFYNQRGSITAAGLIAMTFLIIVIAGAMPMMTTQLKSSGTNRDTLQAQYAAESGIKAALSYILKTKSAPAWGNGSTSINLYDGSAESYTVTVTPTPVSNGTQYKISATGKSGSTSSISRSVSTNILIPTSDDAISSDDLAFFAKYTVFSNGPLQIDNTPTIVGDIGSNGTITVNSSSPLINGKAYTPNVPVMDQYTWNRYAVTGGYVYANPAGSVDASSLIPTAPAITASGTKLSSVAGGSTLSGSYYSNSSYTMSGISSRLTIADGQSVVIYVKGDLTIGGGSSIGDASIIGGDDVTIYATGNIILKNGAKIQTANTGKLKIYAGGTLSLTNTAMINSTNLLIWTQGAINCNSDSSINNISPFTDGVTKIYSKGHIEFTNQFTLGGTGFVVTTNNIMLNTSGNEKNTIFVAGSGKSEVTNNEQIAGIYTNGTLSINSSPKINANNQLSSVLQTLNAGSGGGEPIISGWSNSSN